MLARRRARAAARLSWRIVVRGIAAAALVDISLWVSAAHASLRGKL
jgi:hypothetical protein